MLEIKNVKKSFGKQEVLKDVSLRVEKGDVIVILGPSGSGKTTLLRSLAFLEKADGGVMTLGDKSLDMHNASSKDIAWVRKRTAFVFQNYNLFANKTALENVMLGLTAGRGMKKDEAEVRFAEASRLLEEQKKQLTLLLQEMQQGQRDYENLTQAKHITVGTLMTYNSFFAWKRDQIEMQQQAVRLVEVLHGERKA